MATGGVNPASLLFHTVIAKCPPVDHPITTILFASTRIPLLFTTDCKSVCAHAYASHTSVIGPSMRLISGQSR